MASAFLWTAKGISNAWTGRYVVGDSALTLVLWLIANLDTLVLRGNVTQYQITVAKIHALQTQTVSLALVFLFWLVQRFSVNKGTLAKTTNVSPSTPVPQIISAKAMKLACKDAVLTDVQYWNALIVTKGSVEFPHAKMDTASMRNWLARMVIALISALMSFVLLILLALMEFVSH